MYGFGKEHNTTHNPDVSKIVFKFHGGHKVHNFIFHSLILTLAFWNWLRRFIVGGLSYLVLWEKQYFSYRYEYTINGDQYFKNVAEIFHL